MGWVGAIFTPPYTWVGVAPHPTITITVQTSANLSRVMFIVANCLKCFTMLTGFILDHFFINRFVITFKHSCMIRK